MTLAELAAVLTGTGLPVVYRAWEEPPDLPYLVYFETNTDNFGADNSVYLARRNCIIELYSDRKDMGVEGAVETALSAHDLFFNKTETWIADERLFLAAYTVTI